VTKSAAGLRKDPLCDRAHQSPSAQRGLPLHTARIIAPAMMIVFAHSRALGQAVKSADPIFGRCLMDQTSPSIIATEITQRSQPSTYAYWRRKAMACATRSRTLPLRRRNTRIRRHSTARITPIRVRRGKDQTLAHWHLSPDLIVRQQKTDGKTSERVIYTVSADGKTFTSISWAPGNPELQDVQVFTRGN